MGRFLFDFHAQQTTRNRGSVHATYLVGGNRKQPTPTGQTGTHTKDAEDNCMQSSPFMSSVTSHQAVTDPPIPTCSVILVGEQNLNSRLPSGFSWAGRRTFLVFRGTNSLSRTTDTALKAQLGWIDFIHVYSIEPSSLKVIRIQLALTAALRHTHSVQDLQVLSEGHREMSDKYANEDPLIDGEGYGIIHNSNVKVGLVPLIRWLNNTRNSAEDRTAPSSTHEAFSGYAQEQLEDG